MSRLSFVAEYGRALGQKLMAALVNNPEWIETTCNPIGTQDEMIRPPLEAIVAIRNIIAEHTSGARPDNQTTRRTKADAHLLEAWRAGDKDPEHLMLSWLTIGTPAGILHSPVEVGVFPDCSAHQNAGQTR